MKKDLTLFFGLTLLAYLCSLSDATLPLSLLAGAGAVTALLSAHRGGR